MNLTREKLLKKLKTKLFWQSLILLLLIFHAARDILQALNLNYFWINIGHSWGVKWSNMILGEFRISYKRWMELPFAGIELLTVGWLSKLKKKTKIRLSMAKWF